MRRIILCLVTLGLASCFFAPITVSVPDFFIASGSSSSTICYSKVSESISVSFNSVVYEGDALYQPGQGLGDNSSILLDVYGRSSDPDPSSSSSVKCVSTASSEDIQLSTEPITLEANQSKRVSVGGSSLASLVTQNEYWLGGSLDDGTAFSLPGRIDFTNGVIKANF